MPNRNHDRKKQVAWWTTLAAAVAAVPLLGGCATEGVGYSAQPIAPNRYILSLDGSITGFRRDAEDKLIRRAALLTLQSGYTHFALTTRDIDGKTYFFFGGDTYLHGPDYGRRAGLWPEYPNVPETHYRASVEITMLRPDEAAGNPQAVDASAVLT